MAHVMRRQRPRSERWTLSGLTMLMLGTALPAHAHMAKTKYLTVSSTSEGAEVAVTMPAMDVAMTLGLAPSVDDETLVAQSAPVAVWLEHGLQLFSGPEACTVTKKQRRVDGAKQSRKLTVDMAFRCSGAATVLTDQTLEGAADHQTIVTLQAGDESTAHVLRPDTRTLTLAPTRSIGHVAYTFVVEGILHLVTGFDHLLFVVSLIFAFGLIGRERGWRAALRSVAVLVTAFTLGHSITLVMSALGYVSLPSGPVEAVIALSIVIAAAINVLWPESSVRPQLAAAFGLVHGFGFSSVLSDVGLPSGHTAVALFSFNLGIELGQLAFVGLLLVPLIWLAHRPWYRSVIMTGGSYVVGAFGLVWLIERTAIL